MNEKSNHYQSTHVDTSGMGVSGGMYTAPAGRRRGYPSSMPRAQRDALIADERPRPNGFTGLWGDRYYVRGVERPEMRNAGAFGMIRKGLP